MDRAHKASVRVQAVRHDGHATEEIADDEFVIADIEHAIRSGEVVRIRKDDPRGNIYVVYGKAADGLTPVGVVGRFARRDRFLIVTVYKPV